jgi:hypothetical protein
MAVIPFKLRNLVRNTPKDRLPQLESAPASVQSVSFPHTQD